MTTRGQLYLLELLERCEGDALEVVDLLGATLLALAVQCQRAGGVTLKQSIEKRAVMVEEVDLWLQGHEEDFMPGDWVMVASMLLSAVKSQGEAVQEARARGAVVQ